MLFIGDVHTRIVQYLDIIEGTKEPTIQVGDINVGFRGVAFPSYLPTKDVFIRGNHDKPLDCRSHRNYLGDWGYLPKNKIFYISGAWSPDFYERLIGVNWWADEELSYLDLKHALDKYAEVKPDVVVSHDCPTIMKSFICPEGRDTRTNVVMQQMFEIHKPKYWIFGHYHQLNKRIIDGCQFVCLGIMDTYRIPDLGLQ